MKLSPSVMILNGGCGSARLSCPSGLVRALLFAALVASCSRADPATQDPTARDPYYPPALVEFKLRSHGADLNALLYRAGGDGPHPTAIFLHGYPGNERNLDLAQAVRRAGWNAL